jgi:drug/metabolite transporter (DMT)-like permease
VLGWVLLNQVPSAWFWLGAAMIIGASVFIFVVETQGKSAGPAAATSAA